MDVHDRIPPDPAISRHETSSEVRQWSLLEHATATTSMKTDIKQIFILVEKKS
jgi:hypothetical protein